MSKPCPHRIPPMPLGSPSDGQLTSQPSQGQCQGRLYMEGAEEAASGPVLPGTLTLPAGEPRNKHLIWVRFNTQVKQPCTAPTPQPGAQPALPAAPLRPGLPAGKAGWDPLSAATF